MSREQGFVRSAARICGWLCLLLAAAWLTGCGLFGRDEDPDPPAELVDFEATVEVRRAWATRIGRTDEVMRVGLGPVTDGSRVYAATHNGRVAAIDVDSGRRIWSTRTRLELSGGPGLHDGLLALGTTTGEVIALRAEDGSEAWRADVGGEVLAPPAISRRHVYVRTVDGRLIALRRDDGGRAWFAQQSVPRLSVRGTSAPAIANNRVLAGFDNGKVAAYGADDGALIWEVMVLPPTGRNEVERLADINVTPRLIGDDAYVAGYRGNLSALAVESGEALWVQDVSSYRPLAVDLTNVYATTRRSEVVAVSRRSGRNVWRQDLLLNRKLGGPALFGNSVVVGDFEGYVHWFDAVTGEPLARVRAGRDRITATPLVVGETIVIQSENGRLYAYRQDES